MENKTKNKRRSMTIVIVALELLVLFLIGFVIGYHGQARGLEEQNAVNNEAADRIMASAFLDIHEEMTGDRQAVFSMSLNFDREGFNSLCAGLGSHYIDESNIIAEITEIDPEKYGQYGGISDMTAYFADLEERGKAGLLTEADAETLLGVFDAWESCRWEQLSSDMAGEDFEFIAQDYGIASCLDQIGEAAAGYGESGREA